MSLQHVPIEGEKLEIRPFDIDTSGHFWNAFDHSETEVSAQWIVRLCQKRGTWEPFSEGAIEDFYREKHQDGFTFNKLIRDGWIVERNGLYYVTAGFIVRCFESSPAGGKVES